MDILHIKRIDEIDLWVYDEKGRLYKADLLDPEEDRPLMFWASVVLLHNKDASGNYYSNRLEFGFKEDAYVFGWPGSRLSSLREHEYYWRYKVWLTTTDRDFVFNEFTKGMFD